MGARIGEETRRSQWALNLHEISGAALVGHPRIIHAGSLINDGLSWGAVTLAANIFVAKPLVLSSPDFRRGCRAAAGIQRRGTFYPSMRSKVAFSEDTRHADQCGHHRSVFPAGVKSAWSAV
jgi:hypothetical protein